MNTIKINPKAELLLGAGLNVLHFESKEWMDTIDFWKDEIRFFENLLKKKETSEKNNPQYEKMIQDLNKIHKDLFEDLGDTIIKHEQLLSQIELGEKGISDYNYRDKHREILLRMNTFTKDFKTFKRIVFDYAKGL